MKKGSLPVEVFLKNKPNILKKIKSQAQAPLKDAAAINATRYAIGNMLKNVGLPVTFWTGGRTKYNRCKQGYPKKHFIDAACVGDRGDHVFIPENITPLKTMAQARGSRQMCRMDKYGFPRTSPKAQKAVEDFRTGDRVKAIVTAGKKVGTYVGRVAVRSSGYFNIKTKDGTVQGISWK